jgi:O-antigen/teichoic acid export membrane protein
MAAMGYLRMFSRNLGATWIGYLVQVAVAFPMARFVVDRLGDETYGVWTLLMSLTGYLGLIELGTRAGMGRHVAYYLGRGDTETVNGVLNTGLAVLCVACGVLLAVAGGLSAGFGALFPKVPAELVSAARIALPVVALQLGLSFLAAVFAQVLAAHDRFHLLTLTNLAVLGATTLAVLWTLSRGGGMVELACIQAGGAVLNLLLSGWLASRVFTGFRLRWSYVRRSYARLLMGFSLWAFVGDVATSLLFYTDSLLITWLVGPTGVTLYALAMMPIRYGRSLVEQIVRVLSPQVVRACGAEDRQRLRWLFTWGSRAIALLAVPLFVGLMLLGPELMVLWMGPDKRASGGLLMILALPQVAFMVFRPATSVINGLGRVRFGALLALAQGVMNLVLSAGLVLAGLGLAGVAWGTAATMVCANAVLGVAAMRWIDLPVGEFFRRSVLRWVLGGVLFAGLGLAGRAVPVPSGWWSFIATVLILAILYVPIGWWVVLSRPDRGRLVQVLPGLNPRASNTRE